MTYKNRRLLLLTIPLLASSSALAQTSGDGLEEVVVTAQKTESSEQKTPISMQVYSAEDLLNSGVNNVQSLAQSDPNVSFAYAGGSAYIAMRGIATSNTTETGQPSVAVATDGIFQARSYTLEASMYDIDHIEVLRGPQGTLYGRNAVGGLISIVNAKPKDEFQGRASVDAGNFGKLDIEGMLNLPVASWMQVRVSGVSLYHDGYRHNSPSADGDDADSRSGRLQVALQPFEHLNLLLTGQYTRMTAIGQIAKALPFEAPSQPSHELPDIGSIRRWSVAAPHYTNLRATDFRWEATYDNLPGGLTVTYLGGRESLDYQRGNAVQGTLGFYQNEHPSTISHELRLSSPTDSALFWQVGAYYFREENELVSGLVENKGSLAELTDILFTFTDIPSKSKAVFGQASYELTDNLKLNAGARYTKDSNSREGTLQLIGFSPAPFPITIPLPGSAESTKTTWMTGLDWSVTDRNLLYVKASTGYKAGGFTGAGQYRPESLLAYEAGTKNRFYDDRLQWNAAAYWMKYKDQQLNQFSDPIVGAQTVNADSKIYGVETNLSALVEPVGRIDFGLNYLHARITDFVPPPGYNPAISASIDGNRTPLSPTIAATAKLEHTWSGISDGAFTGRVQAKYESEKFYSANNFQSTRQKPYTTVDLGLDYQRDGANWLVQAYVRNLTDKDVFSDAEEIYNVSPGLYVYSFQAPRTFGVKVTANFD